MKWASPQILYSYCTYLLEMREFLPSLLSLLAPGGVIAIPIVAWWEMESQSSVEEGYDSLVASSWYTSLRKILWKKS